MDLASKGAERLRVLVINSGSSSIKYRVFDADGLSLICRGAVDKIGEGKGIRRHWTAQGVDWKEEIDIKNHDEGLGSIFQALADTGMILDKNNLRGIGHRVVHGGTEFKQPVLIDDGVVETIRRTSSLAPLHNPTNLLGIEYSIRKFPDVPQVAVFDTAFHQSLPPHAYHYALPFDIYKRYGIRRYGFHGTSHQYVARLAAAHLDRPIEDLRLITLHLGNGASATAISGGRSVDTSMGLTPLEGLMMGTRSGDIDPAAHFFIMRQTGKSPEELESMLFHESGLLAIAGTNDMREVERLADGGSERACLAIDMYCHRIRKYIGGYYAVLGKADALVFTGGIGENSALVRKKTCEGLEGLGIHLDEDRNSSVSGEISEIQLAQGAVRLLVIKTDEEKEIARQTLKKARDD